NPRPSGSSASEYNMASVFGRINYTFLDRYLLTVTGRYDGSSKFGANNKFSFFPSAAIGWQLSNEKFLMDNPIISFMKLRTSIGKTGNSEISNYGYEAGLRAYTYIFGDNRFTGIGISTLANPNLKWEINTQFDYGIEIGLFENKVYLEADFYWRYSKGMLLNRPLPRSSGFSIVTENIGSMKNNGVEFSISTFNITKPN